MKKILLLRHAKSDRDNHSGPDFERYLNPRGQKDAPKIAAALAEKEFVPSVIIASPAVRVQETLERMNHVWKPPQIKWEESLYLCSAGTIFDQITRQDELVDYVGFAGHNPCMEDVYAALSGDNESSFPTCAAAVISFACESWLSVAKTPGEVELFLKPREL